MKVFTSLLGKSAMLTQNKSVDFGKGFRVFTLGEGKGRSDSPNLLDLSLYSIYTFTPTVAIIPQWQ